MLTRVLLDRILRTIRLALQFDARVRLLLLLRRRQRIGDGMRRILGRIRTVAIFRLVRRLVRTPLTRSSRHVRLASIGRGGRRNIFHELLIVLVLHRALPTVRLRVRRRRRHVIVLDDGVVDRCHRTAVLLFDADSTRALLIVLRVGMFGRCLGDVSETERDIVRQTKTVRIETLRAVTARRRLVDRAATAASVTVFAIGAAQFTSGPMDRSRNGCQ